MQRWDGQHLQMQPKVTNVQFFQVWIIICTFSVDFRPTLSYIRKRDRRKDVLTLYEAKMVYGHSKKRSENIVSSKRKMNKMNFLWEKGTKWVKATL